MTDTAAAGPRKQGVVLGRSSLWQRSRTSISPWQTAHGGQIRAGLACRQKPRAWGSFIEYPVALEVMGSFCEAIPAGGWRRYAEPGLFEVPGS